MQALTVTVGKPAFQSAQSVHQVELRAELADGQAERAGQFLREARPALEIGGENRIVATEISRLRGGIDVVELRLLRGIRPDELRPERLVSGRVMGLALLDRTEDLVQRACASPGSPCAAGRFRGGAGGGETGLFLGGERATEGGDGNMAQGVVTAFLGELRVGERLDPRLELAQEKIDGKVEAGLARLDQKPVLNLQPDLAVAARLHDEIGLRGRAVAEHALEAVGLDAAALDLRFEIAAQSEFAVGLQFLALVARR